ncbi:hypothetical protein SHELI_v1c06630 [Spiroplasma helicoides]|uniref:GTP cyclohydrolase 1 type 2 homolog n=1 Tax=Spiroplasma helicoides TaxID=216938 RepID=A0A1B3SL06_9MOLU|nr:Nif3-like dinuclear metal center hexameric protein [Spiroplasma helicoides]AOG60614.1 hypothetical protein SHELI_v1c06630 [Spiroplasma helicoides]
MSKVKINNLINYLKDLFPQSNAAEWDKVGFQIEDVYNLPSQDEVENVLVCMDLTKDALKKAIDKKVNFIITRHPFFFLEKEEELKNPAKKEIFDQLVENQIQVYSIHTNYESSPDNNLMDLIETQFNINENQKVGEFLEGNKIKLLREISLKEVIEKMKFIFGKETTLLTRNSNLENQIKTIYITPGSGASTMVYLHLKDTVFITGEAKWSEWLYADQNNVDMLVLGHYMENHFIDDIESKINKTFNGEINVYTFDIKNPFKYV